MLCGRLSSATTTANRASKLWKEPRSVGRTTPLRSQTRTRWRPWVPIQPEERPTMLVVVLTRQAPQPASTSDQGIGSSSGSSGTGVSVWEGCGWSGMDWSGTSWTSLAMSGAMTEGGDGTGGSGTDGCAGAGNTGGCRGRLSGATKTASSKRAVATASPEEILR